MDGGYVLDGAQLAEAIAQIATSTIYAAFGGDRAFVKLMEKYGKDTAEFVKLGEMEVPPAVEGWVRANFKPGKDVKEALASELRIAFSGWQWMYPAEANLPSDAPRTRWPATKGPGNENLQQSGDYPASRPLPHVMGKDSEETHKTHSARDYAEARGFILHTHVFVPAFTAERKPGAKPSVATGTRVPMVPTDRGDVRNLTSIALQNHCLPNCVPVDPKP